MTLTVGQLVSAIESLTEIAMAVASVPEGVPNLASLPQDVAVTDDILSVIATFWPPAAMIEVLLPVAAAVAEWAAANPGTGANDDPLGPHEGRRA